MADDAKPNSEKQRVEPDGEPRQLFAANPFQRRLAPAPFGKNLRVFFEKVVSIWAFWGCIFRHKTKLSRCMVILSLVWTG